MVVSRFSPTLAAVGVLALAAAGVGVAQDRGQELQPKLQGRELVEAVRGGGHVLLFRHTSTTAKAEAEVAELGDCSTQRNLSDEGRQQAERIGRSFEKLGIQVDKVLVSPYCRCVDTGKLAFGEVTTSELLSVGDELPIEEKVGRGAQVRKLLATKPPAGKNTVLITHTGNLLYTFGLTPRPEGIAHVFKAIGVGPPIYQGMITPEEWPAIAGLTPAIP